MVRTTDPSPAFRFHVEVEGIKIAWFTECSGLEFEQETFDYKEGGVNSHPHRLPGRFKFTNLTLKRGVAKDGGPLWDWVKETARDANRGKWTTHDVTVTLYDISGQSPQRTWMFLKAYPVKWSASNLTAEQSAIAIETLVLAHQGMDFAK